VFSKGLIVLFGAAVAYVFVSSGVSSRGWARVALILLTVGSFALLAALARALFIAR